jgi:hypothetical protein
MPKLLGEKGLKMKLFNCDAYEQTNWRIVRGTQGRRRLFGDDKCARGP